MLQIVCVDEGGDTGLDDVELNSNDRAVTGRRDCCHASKGIDLSDGTRWHDGGMADAIGIPGSVLGGGLEDLTACFAAGSGRR